MAALVALTALTGGAAAASNGSLTAEPGGPGATATHTATVTVGSSSAGSWNGLQVDYTTGETSADVSDVGTEDIVTIGIDRDDDAEGATIDTNVTDDVDQIKSSNDGKTLTVDLGGSYDVSEGDELVVVYEDAVNPDATGDFDVGIDVNPQSSGGQVTASLAVSTGSGDDTTTAGDTTTDDGGDDTTDDSESGGTPGFTVGVGLVAVLGAALVALRRR